MILTLAALLTALTVTVDTDTTFKVRSGARLNVNNFGGEIAVRTWDKNSVRVQAQHSSRVAIDIGETGSTIDVRAHSRRGIPARVDYRFTVPEWMALGLSGVYTDVTIEGSKGEVNAETVKGDVTVTGGEGLVRLSSVQGAVHVAGSRGRLMVSAVNDGVNVVDVVGEVSIDAVNGDVLLERIRSKEVEAATVNGSVTYVGSIEDGGRYRFASHNGDLTIAVPERTNATISIATFNGEFDSSFPVQLTETKRGKRFMFTLGDGSAQIDLETFEGTIRLRRAIAGKLKEKDE